MRRVYYYAAGVLAFLLGVPLTQKAFGQEGLHIFWESLDLAGAIASASDSDS